MGKNVPSRSGVSAAAFAILAAAAIGLAVTNSALAVDQPDNKDGKKAKVVPKNAKVDPKNAVKINPKNASKLDPKNVKLDPKNATKLDPKNAALGKGNP